MADIRQGFRVHRPRGRSVRIRFTMTDFSLFRIFFGFMAGFLLLAQFVRPGSFVWAWTIVIFASFYTRIPFIYIHSVRLCSYERMIICLITVVAWISFRCLFDSEENFTTILSYILISPLSGLTVRAVQLALGLSLFLTSAALTRPAPSPYSPPPTTPAPPPVPPPLAWPPLVPIRPPIFTPVLPSRPPSPRVSAHVSRQVLCCGMEAEYVDYYTPYFGCSEYMRMDIPRVTTRRIMPRVDLYWRV